MPTHPTLLSLDEPARPGAAPAWALWQLGFRPFYLLAGAFAALSVPLWALQFVGWLPRPEHALWHAHEMLFGYALAVVVGFLFTAGRNWTGRPTPTGAALAALAALWVAARVLVQTRLGWAAAFANAAFVFAAAAALARALVGARNRRNYFFVGALLLLGAAQFGVHLVQVGALELPGQRLVRFGLDVLLFIIVVMTGRVVPMFTNNGVPGARARNRPMLEKAALGSVIALGAADALGAHGPALAALLGAAAAVLALRLWGWQPWRTLHTPLVWVLHAGCAWIVLHLGLRAAAELGWLAPSLATHAFTVGTIGGLTLGMMTRTARGHTARPLRADGFELAAYFAVNAAALVRVGLPLFAPPLTLVAVVASALLWSLAYTIFTLRYWPILTRARLDGRPG